MAQYGDWTDKIARQVLDPGEQLLWSGRPKITLPSVPSTAATFGCALVVVLGGLAALILLGFLFLVAIVLSMDVSGKQPQDSPPWWLLGLPLFCMVGFVLWLMGRGRLRNDANQRLPHTSNDLYFVTDRRILVLKVQRNVPSIETSLYSVRSADVSEDNPIAGIGSAMLRGNSDSDGQGLESSVRLREITNPSAVVRLIAKQVYFSDTTGASGLSKSESSRVS